MQTIKFNLVRHLKFVVIMSAFALGACNSSSDSDPDNAQVSTQVGDQDSTQNSASDLANLPLETSANDQYSPYVDREYPTEVYFGDTHLHTSNSGDAFAYGARLSPDDAYRFARGETVTSTTGQLVKLSRPLDFLVVADHAEGLGVMQSLLEGNTTLLEDPQMARWNKMMAAGEKQAQLATREIISGLANKTLPPIISNPKLAAPFAKSVWHKYIQSAERFNQPGRFTSLIGYEYTSVPKGDNLHRVVVFRDGAEKTKSIFPFSSMMSEDPEDLWAALENYEQKTGGKVLAIPHNSNLSNGRMFALVDFEGSAIDANYAAKRARWEPLVEATQIKGDSESHPVLSPNDEYASYGDQGWENGNLTVQTATTDEMLKGNYVREGLKRGLLLEQQTGINPYKFGMIGSTDSHTGLATADENNFFGKNNQMEPRPDRVTKTYKKSKIATIYGWHYLAGGYAAVWAQENTREALFDAMLRKEVYATTGPRIKLRFFGGFGFTEKMSKLPNLASVGYSKGVPMGADLHQQPGDKAPQFLVRALKDPEGSNLALLQIIKGWVTEDGSIKEHVYDIQTGNPDTGSSELSAFWQDPNFNQVQNAFYYVRVLETPSYRWPVYDAKFYKIDIPDKAGKPVQERAYSSPIWYQP